MSSGKFENFLSLMKENWSEAHENLLPAFPRIDRIAALHNMERAKIMSVYGLQPSDFGLLTALRRSGSPYLLSPTQLCDYMLVSSGGLTKALYRLEEKGMISRSAKEGDGRVKLVALTEKGKTTIEEAVSKVQRVHAVLANEFTEQELAQFDQFLARFLSVIEQDSGISN